MAHLGDPLPVSVGGGARAGEAVVEDGVHRAHDALQGIAVHRAPPGNRPRPGPLAEGTHIQLILARLPATCIATELIRLFTCLLGLKLCLLFEIVQKPLLSINLKYKYFIK